jgi:LPS export ABC transporter protein LptC
LVALLIAGSAILLFSCKAKSSVAEESLDAIKTEESENLTIVMSENGRKSYLFKTPLLEGYTLGRDPYREFRKGISITTYQDDSLTTVNANLVANYAIYYEKRKLWEAKGDVVITKHDGTRVYTQQLFWNSATKRIYSNVDTKLVTDTDEVIGEGFESDEEMNEPRFRRWKGRMQVDMEQLRKEQQEGGSEEQENTGDELFPGEPQPTATSSSSSAKAEPKPTTSANTATSAKPQPVSPPALHPKANRKDNPFNKPPVNHRQRPTENAPAGQAPAPQKRPSVEKRPVGTAPIKKGE